MPRFFVENIDATFTIEGSDARHISGSLRIRAGGFIEVASQSGIYRAEVTAVEGERVHLRLCEKIDAQNELRVNVTLYQAVPKGQKLDYIVEKCVELGVSKIVPMYTARTIGVLSANKLERLNRIAGAAAKQSLRGCVPPVTGPVTFDAAAGEFAVCGLPLFFWEGETERSFKSVLSAKLDSKTDIGIMIGAEGGFSLDEVGILRDKGVNPISLGNRILRCETAPIAVMAAIGYEIQEM